MAEEGLAALLLTTEAELRWFTGFQTLFWQSPTRPWFLFVPAEGPPIAVIPEIGAPVMRRTWVTDIRTWSAPQPADDGVSLVAELLAPLAKRGERLGLPMGHETRLAMPLADFERLRALVPGLALADCGPLVQRLRAVKSEGEIARIAYACAVASATFDRVPHFAAEGVPLAAVFREFRRTALAFGADDVPYLVGGAGPGGYEDVISPPDERPLAAGDVLMLDTGLRFDGYHCDFDRNFALGRANDRARRAHELLWRATEAGLDAACAGVRASDVFAAMARVLETWDGANGGGIGRVGHGLGLQLTEQPSLAPFDRSVLEANTVLTLEPSLALGDGLTMVHEENIVVTEGAPRLLSARAPAELPVLEGRLRFGM